MLIRSQEEFEEMLMGEGCRPAIDFSKYDLLLGNKQLTSGNTSIEYLLLHTCKDSEFLLHVIFHQNITAEAPNITYHRLIPKLQPNESVKVEILINY